MQRLPARIEGDGVLLRRWRVEDAEALERVITASVEHLRPWMPWIADEPMEFLARLALLRKWQDEWEQGGDAIYAVIREGEFAGSCGLHRRIGDDGLELGYWTAKPFLEKGLATEVARLLAEAAFQLAEIDQVEIRHDKANTASAGIPKRLGYEFIEERASEKTAPAESGMQLVWRLTRAKENACKSP